MTRVHAYSRASIHASHGQPGRSSWASSSTPSAPAFPTPSSSSTSTTYGTSGWALPGSSSRRSARPASQPGLPSERSSIESGPAGCSGPRSRCSPRATPSSLSSDRPGRPSSPPSSSESVVVHSGLAQLTFLGRLVPAARRHAAWGLQRTFLNLGLGLGGLVGGLIARTDEPRTFAVLFGVNVATSLGYALILVFVSPPRAPSGERDPARPCPAQATPVRGTTFMGLMGLNVVLIAVGNAQLELVPVLRRTRLERDGHRPRLPRRDARARRLPASGGESARGPFADAGTRARTVPGQWHGSSSKGRHLARGGRRGCRLRGRGDRLRPRRVLSRAELRAARRGPRAAWARGTLLGGVVGLVGARLRARPGRGRLRARHGAVRSLPLAAAACLVAATVAVGLERAIPRELRLTPA